MEGQGTYTKVLPKQLLQYGRFTFQAIFREEFSNEPDLKNAKPVLLRFVFPQTSFLDYSFLFTNLSVKRL